MKAFAPHYVVHDGKCLSFRGYFKEQMPEYFQEEQLLYRKINIIYYLEDDTMTIIEPPIPVSLLFFRTRTYRYLLQVRPHHYLVLNVVRTQTACAL